MCRMVAAGLLLSGTTLHLWFTLMFKTLPFQDLMSILKKMALGQVVYGPVFNTLFFSFNAYLQGILLIELKKLNINKILTNF